jgi:MFS family permease
VTRAAPGAPSRSSTTSLVVASAAQAALSFVILGLPAIGPQLSDTFGLSLAGLGAVLAMLSLGSGLALLAADVAIVRFGERIATAAGTALAVLGLSFAAVASGKWTLALGLFVTGLGGAVVPVSGAVAIFRVYPAGRRAWALGVRQMAVPLGGTVAALTVPPLEHAGGTRLVLAVGAALVAVAGGCFAVLSEGGRSPHRSQRSFRRIWRAPGMQRLFLLVLFYMVVLQAVLVYTVPAVTDAGFSALVVGSTYFVINVTAIVSRLAWGRIADGASGTRSVRSLTEIGLVSFVGAVLFAVALHAGPAVLLPAAVLVGFGALGWNAVLYAAAGERAPPEIAGRSFAVAGTVIFVASALVNPALGALADHVGWDAFWLVTGVVGLLGAALATTLPRRVAAAVAG